MPTEALLEGDKESFMTVDSPGEEPRLTDET